MTPEGRARPAPAAAPVPTGPLTGTAVLDLSFMGPGPRCTRLLADYGATVVKVAPVPGSAVRQIQPPPYAYSGDRGMSHVHVDLKEEGGRAAFLALAATADVVVEAFRPGVADRLGIGYDAVRSVNSGVVYCSVTGYGPAGPRRSWAGHDLDYLAVGGFLAAGGRRSDGGPPVPGATVADAAAGGMHAALAVTTALVGRRATGRGVHLEVCTVDGVVWLCSLMVDEYLATGTEARPGAGLLTGRYACYDTYETSDGRWIAVAAIETAFFANLCRALGCEEWVPHQFDDGAQDAVRAAFARAFASGTQAHWVERLAGAETCVAPVRTIAEVAADPLTPVVEAAHPVAGRFRQLAPLLAGTVPVREPVVLPDPGATDTAALLRAAGVGEETVAGWLAGGVIA